MNGIDPRTLGFNYGIGWERDGKPPIYEQATALARRLGKQAVEASRIAWEVEHALWKTRISESEKEKAMAISELTAIVQKYDRSVASCSSDP